MDQRTTAVIIDRTLNPEGAADQIMTYRLKIPPTLVYLRGHFSELQLLPGVTQIHWACMLAEPLTGEITTTNIEKLKFTAPIFPNTEVQLALRITKRYRLQFEFRQGVIINSKGLIHYECVSV